jgi:hypothetical protein
MLNQRDTDFFRPLWRRVLVTVLIAVWAVLEWFVWGEEIWQWVTLAALAYAIWMFFIRFDKTGQGPGNTTP